MGKVRRDDSEKEVVEGFLQFLEGAARFVAWGGLLATLVGLGFLVFYVIQFGRYTTLNEEAALANTEIFRQVLTYGLIGLFVGSAYLFWGADWLGFSQLLVAGVIYFAPAYGPALLGSPQSMHKVVAAALIQMQRSGMAAGIIAIGVLVIDLIIRTQGRFRQGIKADQLKYGKGIREEVDRNNVFLGKCWQLPFCRKFVRDRCPIYHSRRTCWKEKVGCMCEEEVIKGAMENRAIPKDAVAAARYIPRNNKITLGQKIDRCRQCVIYNEHQKHKYRAILPLILVGFGLFYWVARTPLLAMTKALVDSVNELIGHATLGKGGNIKPPQTFQELLLVCLVVIALAYAMKLLEYLIFKLKV